MSELKKHRTIGRLITRLIKYYTGGLVIGFTMYYGWTYLREKQQEKQFCEQCQSNKVTATIHYRFGWHNYYLLNYYCDDPKVLREISQLAKQVAIKDADTITTYSFVQFPFHSNGGGEVEDWDEVNEKVVAGFIFNRINRKLLNDVWFEPTSDLKAADFFKSDSLYKSRRDTLNITYKASYEKIDGSVLNAFIKQAGMNKAREKFKFCNYDLHNTNTQRVESSIRYVNYGKGFYFDIW